MKGRPSKYTPALGRKLCKMIRDGLDQKTACKAAGVSETAFYRWLSQGEKDQENGEESDFRDFRESVEKARAEGEANQAAVVIKAAKGGIRQKTKRVVSKKLIVEGVVVEERIEETVTVASSGADWKAASWWLTRIHPERDELGVCRQ